MVPTGIHVGIFRADFGIFVAFFFSRLVQLAKKSSGRNRTRLIAYYAYVVAGLQILVILLASLNSNVRLVPYDLGFTSSFNPQSAQISCQPEARFAESGMPFDNNFFRDSNRKCKLCYFRSCLEQCSLCLPFVEDVSKKVCIINTISLTVKWLITHI